MQTKDIGCFVLGVSGRPDNGYPFLFSRDAAGQNPTIALGIPSVAGLALSLEINGRDWHGLGGNDRAVPALLQRRDRDNLFGRQRLVVGRYPRAIGAQAEAVAP